MFFRRETLGPIAVLLTAMVSIQSGATLAKQMFPLVGPAGSTSLRLLVAVLMLSCVWRPFRGTPRGDLKYVVGYGVCLGCMNLLFYSALARIPLGPAVALEFTGPLAVALTASRRFTDFVWVGLAALGISLLSPWAGASEIDPLGALFAVGAGAGWAGYILFGKRAGRALKGGALASTGMVVAAATIFPWGVPDLLRGPPLLDLLPLALAVGLFSSALPYTLEMMALKQMEPRAFSVLLSMEPAVAAMSGLVFLNERLTLAQCAAIGCIILASAGSSWAARPAAPAQAV